MAFGDGDNDLELLQMAGHSYAMENASPAILQVADQIAPHHKDQGSIDCLRRLFRIGFKDRVVE